MSETNSGASSSALDPADFAQRVLQVVSDGTLTSSYKLAVLLGLIDVSMERITRDPPMPSRFRSSAAKSSSCIGHRRCPIPGMMWCCGNRALLARPESSLWSTRFGGGLSRTDRSTWHKPELSTRRDINASSTPW